MEIKKDLFLYKFDDIFNIDKVVEFEEMSFNDTLLIHQTLKDKYDHVCLIFKIALKVWELTRFISDLILERNVCNVLV